MKWTETDGAYPEAERWLARSRLLGLLGAGGLEDSEAQAIAGEAVRRARSDAQERDEELPVPPPDEVRERLRVRESGEPDDTC